MKLTQIEDLRIEPETPQISGITIWTFQVVIDDHTDVTKLLQGYVTSSNSKPTHLFQLQVSFESTFRIESLRHCNNV
ncbi:hypothetical protein MTR_5g034740 [Medicago truncatula]|uniref:Uncharacterized protein n=1 Tax=Medicago truncatula TaxID=3880 RepID=G7K1H3_MEDTR|nr:hypothetical protein MTR_5g034740 [Medicago truncatula]